MRAAIATALVALAAGCGDDASHHDESYNCAEETRADEFVTGLEKTGAMGKLTFQLLSAAPAPPARGDNTWVIQVNSITGGSTGAPLTGATMTVTPFMPDHGHGSPKQTMVEAMPEPGQYQLAPVNMWMPGLWETTINVSGPESDKATFRFCLPS
ncbi:MAG: FixH family protein [Kofleriaceae bacterium]